jgi:hypothetical protein
VRNVQRLERTPDGARLRFIDIGGRVAEELDEVEIALLRAPAPVANFGWGRNADGLAREGTFYIDSAGFAVGRAPAGETGFIQPAAQWGREQQAFVAGSGPVTIGPGAATIELLCGDLVSGEVYAVSRSFAELAQELHRVALRDAALQPVTLAALAGGRPDPRFFAFPDGSAGVLLERTGAFYRLGELPCSTAGFTAVGSGCGAATLGVEALPRVGTPAVVVLQGSGPGEPAVFLASPVRAVPPLALGAFGMPGCVSHLSGPSVLGFVVCDAVGTARQPVWIPGTVMLCGLELPVQAAVHAPGLNAAAIAMTGAVVLRAGL